MPVRLTDKGIAGPNENSATLRNGQSARVRVSVLKYLFCDRDPQFRIYLDIAIELLALPVRWQLQLRSSNTVARIQLYERSRLGPTGILV